jgi:hypothetical protein
VTVFEREVTPVREGDGDAEGQAEADGETDSDLNVLALTDALPEALIVPEPEKVGELVPVGEIVRVPELQREPVPDVLADGDTDGEPLGERDPTGLTLGVVVRDSVAVTDTVTDDDKTLVGVTDGV